MSENTNPDNQNSQYNSEEAVAFFYLMIAGIAFYAIIFIVSMLAVILTITLTAAAGYIGYKAALDGQLWQDRKIDRQKKVEAQRQRHLHYHETEGREWMKDVVENYCDDKLREQYQEKDYLSGITKTVRSIREMFK